MYLPNKYTTWYYRIILRAQQRPTITEYVERHHIIPKSLGGDESASNFAHLTPREHFICHWLLPKMLTGRARHKMAYALLCMSNPTRYQAHRDFKVTSRHYDVIRRLVSDAKKGEQAGNKNVSCRPEMRELRRAQWITNNPSKGKSWIHNTVQDKLVPREEIDQWLNDGWIKGRIVTQTIIESGKKNAGRVHSAETRAKVSAAGRLRVHTAATKEKQRQAALRRYGKI